MNILVYVPDNREGKTAFARGVAEARWRDANLILASYVHVDAERSSEHTVAHAQEQLDTLMTQAHERGVRSTSAKVLPGVQGAATTVLELAFALPADLLVVGIRRRSPVGKLVLGSVAQDLLLGAECPVLAVKPAIGAGD